MIDGWLCLGLFGWNCGFSLVFDFRVGWYNISSVGLLLEIAIVPRFYGFVVCGFSVWLLVGWYVWFLDFVVLWYLRITFGSLLV